MSKAFLNAVLLGCALFTVQAQALTLKFSPQNQVKFLGDTVNVDIIATDLGTDIISAYDLDVGFNQTILLGMGVTFYDKLGGPADSFSGFTLGVNVIDLWELSLIVDETILDAMQDDPITLATLTFKAIGVGLSGLSFLPDTVPGVSGQDVKTWDAQLANTSIEDGSVEVIRDPNGRIPVAPSWMLLGIGAAALVTMRRFAVV
ncbi:hypothetical protein [Chitinivorax sp. B]|uniref:hypothetical protein n=1 Tax=Chitinivorax sp. B TaxID=2502235 RepID=UPI0010F7084A|nr:hypothetical protein [Chitinivorax sp. B]